MTVLNNESTIETASITRLAQHLSLVGLTAFTALRPASMETDPRHTYNECHMVQLRDIQTDQFQFPITATVLELDPINLASLSEGVITNLFFETKDKDEEPLYDDDFIVRPHYTREFEIRVGTINIDRTLPKIFVD